MIFTDERNIVWKTQSWKGDAKQFLLANDYLVKQFYWNSIFRASSNGKSHKFNFEFIICCRRAARRGPLELTSQTFDQVRFG